MKKSILNISNEDEVQSWFIPDVEVIEKIDTDLFGRKKEEIVEKEEEVVVIVPPTQQEIAAIRDDAYNEGLTQGYTDGFAKGEAEGILEGVEKGHAKGLEQGHDQAYQEAKAEIEKKFATIDSIITQFEAPLDILDKKIENQLLNLVIDLAKSVIGDELKTSPDYILKSIHDAISALPLKKQNVTLRVNPKDLEIITSFYSKEQLAENKWNLDPDHTLKVGDCIIQSGRSTVDARVATKVGVVFKNIEEQLALKEHKVEVLEANLIASKDVSEELIEEQSSKEGEDNLGAE